METGWCHVRKIFYLAVATLLIGGRQINNMAAARFIHSLFPPYVAVIIYLAATTSLSDAR